MCLQRSGTQCTINGQSLYMMGGQEVCGMAAICVSMYLDIPCSAGWQDLHDCAPHATSAKPAHYGIYGVPTSRRSRECILTTPPPTLCTIRH